MSTDLTTDQLNSAVSLASELGEEVTTDVARAIAGYWHDGQGSAFYAFCSSGHYDRAALLTELSDTIAQAYTTAAPTDQLQLDMLGTYLLNRHQGHYSRLGGTWWCDTCDSPYCELA